MLVTSPTIPISLLAQPLQCLEDAQPWSLYLGKLLPTVSPLGLCPVTFALQHYFTQSKQYLLKYWDKNLYKIR